MELQSKFMVPKTLLQEVRNQGNTIFHSNSDLLHVTVHLPDDMVNLSLVGHSMSNQPGCNMTRLRCF